jgi:hypothetical protein
MTLTPSEYVGLAEALTHRWGHDSR